jgi:hypothetical protein
MSGFNCYKTFAAMTLHFNTDSYDFFKYKGAVNRSAAAFESHKDAWRYEKLAKDYPDPEELRLFMACNFVSDEKLKWVGGLQTQEATERYRKTRGAIDSMRRWFKDELDKLLRLYTVDDLISAEAGATPVLARLLLQNIASPLFSVSLDRSVLKHLEYWRDKTNNDVVRSLSVRLIRYQPFVASEKRPELAEIFTAALQRAED